MIRGTEALQTLPGHLEEQTQLIRGTEGLQTLPGVVVRSRHTIRLHDTNQDSLTTREARKYRRSAFLSLQLGWSPLAVERVQCQRPLEGHGLRRIPASGPFSPAVHEALMRVETDKVAEGEIVAELRAGYMLYERVLRPAQVSVAAKPASPAVDSRKD